MFGGQFGVARSIADSKLPPVYAYAVETAIQLTLTELNENLREIYIEAYSLPETSEYIYLHTTAELKQIFGEKFPDDTESDFYEMEIGTAGLMRSYMARKCDIHFPLERKLSRFLTAAMRVYRVPEAEQAKVLAFIQSLDIKAIATEVMYKLFAMLEMKYDFKLSKDSKGEETIKKILSVVLILCVMLAVMPMTAYAANIALCRKCGQIQTVRVTYQYANDKLHRTALTCTVCDNTWDYWESHMWSGTATCTSGRTCTDCGGSSEPLGHDWGAWTQNSDEKTHTRICKRDTSHTETENCHGGTATCTHKAVCEVCGGEYGEMAAHSFTAEKAEAQYLKSAATCTEKAIYYKSCAVCGLSSEGTADEATFFSGNVLDHDWGAWTQNSDEKTHTRICKRDTSHTETENCHGGTATCTHKAVCEVCGGEYGEMAAHSFTAEKAEAQYLKSAATCTEKAIYYKSCAVCGLSSEGTADEATFFSGNALDHNWGAWTSNEDGTHTRTCTVDGCSAGTQTENCIDANKDHKCDICDYIISECADDNKDHKCDYCGKKLTEHTGGKATCKDKAKCEVCGAEYGELDAKNHTNLKHFPATAATKTTEGNIEYWYCEGCGKYYSDKDGTKGIKKADTVTAKLKDDSKSPQTGDTSNLALWIALLFVSGGAAIGTTVVSRKKKYNR